MTENPGTTTPTVDPYKLDAYQVGMLAKALNLMNAMSSETGVDLCGFGPTNILVGDVNLHLAGTGEGTNRRYHLDMGPR